VNAVAGVVKQAWNIGRLLETLLRTCGNCCQDRLEQSKGIEFNMEVFAAAKDIYQSHTQEITDSESVVGKTLRQNQFMRLKLLSETTLLF
jgi:hypothetical protein